MSFSKLKRIHVIIIGCALCVIAGVAVFFLQVKPQKDAFAAAKARYDTASVKGNEMSKVQAIKQRDDAIKAMHLAQAQLDVQMRLRMPDLTQDRRKELAKRVRHGDLHRAIGDTVAKFHDAVFA